MSLNWLRQKLIQSKAIDPCFGIQTLDLKNDENIPKRLRDSLISETSEDHQQVGYDPIQDSCDSESETETWEETRECQDGCNHIGCFPINLTETEIFIAPKRETSSCTVSLIPNSSSISLVATNECDNRDFLSITYLVPLRNDVIIHWKFNSNYSLRGFNVYVDGNLASKIYSPERSSELLSSINMKEPHHFAVSIIPNEWTTLSSETKRILEPATFSFNPRV